jgi:hypothetical protein
MVRYCQSCGRAAPNDAVLCPYCGVHIDYSRSQIMPDQKPAEKDSKIALIIVLVVVVLIAITVAIAATVYVYVSGMIGPEGISHSPDVFVSETDNKISIRLVQEGTDYNSGYTNFEILINGDPVDDLSEVGSWTIGESIVVGMSTTGYEVGGTSLVPGEYIVTVVISNTIISTDEIEI